MQYLAILSLLTAAYAQQASNVTLTSLLNEPSLSTLKQIILGFPNSTIGALTAPNTSFTIFAPNNEAFAALPGYATSNVEAVQKLVTYHVARGVHPASELEDLTFLRTLAAYPDLVNLGGGDAQVVYAENASIYSGSLLDPATVVSADNFYQGGVVHIIDTVLTIPGSASINALSAGLTTLASALNSTNLTSAVDTTPGITILAPSNAAFTAAGNVSQAALSDILKYHVIAGVYYSTALTNASSLPTLNGANVTFYTNDTGSYFNGAAITRTNVLTKNGVIHLIDSVLTPDTADQYNFSSSNGTNSTSGTGSGSNSTDTGSSDSGVEDDGVEGGFGNVDGTPAETSAGAPGATQSGQQPSASSTESSFALSSNKVSSSFFAAMFGLTAVYMAQ